MRVDSFNYVDVALGMLRREPVFTDANYGIVVHAVRLTLVVPLAGVFAVLGANEQTAVLWPLACSLGSVALTYLVGRDLGGPVVAWIAAAAVAVHGLEVLYATQLLPDAVVPCFVLLALWLYLRERFLFAGVALGLAYFARLNAPTVLLFLLPYSALRRSIDRRLLWLVPGFLGVLLLGEVVFWLNGGVVGFGVTRQFLPFFTARSDFAPPTRLAELYSYALMLWTNGLFRPWTVAFLAAAMVLAALRPVRWWVPLLWFVSLYLYLEVLSQVPVKSMPEKGDRFLSVLASPIGIAIGMALITLTRWIRPLWARGPVRVAALGALVPLVVLPSLARVPAEKETYWLWRGKFMHDLARAVGQLPRGDVYFVNDWRPYVNLYLGYSPEALRPGGPARSAPLDSGEVARLKAGGPDYGSWVPQVRDAYVVQDVGVMLRRPAGWQPVGRADPQNHFFYAPADLDPARWLVHLEPELFDGVKPDQDNALADLTGWGSYSQTAYSRGKAAIGKTAGARMGKSIPSVPAGPLRLRVKVYDYGTGGENRVALTLNGARGEVAWSGTVPGHRELELMLTPEREGGEMAIELVAIGQSFVIVDAVDVEPG